MRFRLVASLLAAGLWVPSVDHEAAAGTGADDACSAIAVEAVTRCGNTDAREEQYDEEHDRRAGAAPAANGAAARAWTGAP
eukprot:1451833-Prymnesium_polylepis.1